jgi:hypothetical protein
MLLLKQQENLLYLKVTSFKYQREVAFYESILDIKDATVSEKHLSKVIEVTPLSFNEYAGYLLHQSYIQTVDVTICQFANQRLPRNVL